MSKDELTCAKLTRVQFVRSFSSQTVSASLLRFTLIICSEFNDPVEGIIRDVDFCISLLSWPTDSLLREVMNEPALELKQRVDVVGDMAKIVVRLPPLEGSFCLHIRAKFKTGSSLASGVRILPLLSEQFTVLAEDDSRDERRSGLVLLSCYRTIGCTSLQAGNSPHQCGVFDGPTAVSAVVREEYGRTLGAHLYDSSLVLLRHLEAAPGGGSAVVGRSVVELGAGCGLVGVWCAKLMAAAADELLASSPVAAESSGGWPGRVHLTDLACQRRLTEHNMRINGCGEALCRFHELGWGCEAQALGLLDSVRRDAHCGATGLVDLIIATDVLYDRGAAELLFRTIRALATPGHTRVLLAQKLRDNGRRGGETQAGHTGDVSEPPSTTVDSLRVDVRSTEGFACVEVAREEANVIVWTMLCV